MSLEPMLSIVQSVWNRQTVEVRGSVFKFTYLLGHAMRVASHARHDVAKEYLAMAQDILNASIRANASSSVLWRAETLYHAAHMACHHVKMVQLGYATLQQVG